MNTQNTNTAVANTAPQTKLSGLDSLDQSMGIFAQTLGQCQAQATNPATAPEQLARVSTQVGVMGAIIGIANYRVARETHEIIRNLDRTASQAWHWVVSAAIGAAAFGLCFFAPGTALTHNLLGLVVGFMVFSVAAVVFKWPRGTAHQNYSIIAEDAVVIDPEPEPKDEPEPEPEPEPKDETPKAKVKKPEPKPEPAKRNERKKPATGGQKPARRTSAADD
ncbi:MAG: hypothetical protein LBH36_03325 [Candidatus Nomurabacteria bacterium]|jgi:hypothetical protein|nr:hypothetical protein [Candidatus Nomurabacteria bacterium]